MTSKQKDTYKKLIDTGKQFTAKDIMNLKVRPSLLDTSDLNRDWDTYCHKIGANQWTCTKEECHCHLKEKIV